MINASSVARRNALKAATAPVVLSLSRTASAVPGTTPNVVFITGTIWVMPTFPAMAGGSIKPPNLDRLANISRKRKDGEYHSSNTYLPLAQVFGWLVKGML